MKMHPQPQASSPFGLLPTDVWQRLRAMQQEWTAASAAVAGPASTAPERIEAASQALLDLQTVALEAGLLLAETIDCGMVLLEPGPRPDTEVPSSAASRTEVAQQSHLGLSQPEPEPGPEPEPATKPEQLSDYDLEMGLAQLQRRLQRGPDPLPAAPKGRSDKSVMEALDHLRARIGGLPRALPDRGAVCGLLAQTEQGLQSDSDWAILVGTHRRLAIELLGARIRAALQAVGQVCRSDQELVRRGRKVLKQLNQLAAARIVDRSPRGLDERHLQPGIDWLAAARDRQKEVDGLLGKLPPEVQTTFNVDDAFRRLHEDNNQLDTAAFCARLQELLDRGAAVDHTRFVRLVGPRLAELAGQPGLTRLANAVHKVLVEAATDVDAPTQPLDPNWPGFACTRGKRAVLVGGDGRQERLPQLQERFGFASLEWPDLPKNAPGKVSKLVQRVKADNFDVVICLQQFVSHSVTEQLFPLKRQGVKVVLASGYGAVQIQLGLERYLLDRNGDQ